jgi:hypothetical protein
MAHSFAADFGHRFGQCFRAEAQTIPLESCIDHSGVTLPRTLIGPVIVACAKSFAYAAHKHRLRSHAFASFIHLGHSPR